MDCQSEVYRPENDNDGFKVQGAAAAKPKGRWIRGRGTDLNEKPLDQPEEKKFCPLCKKNGEMPSLYRSHNLKDEDGRVVCPVLFKFTCPICKATGPDAHTESYCPARPIGPSITGALKNTARNAVGMRRAVPKK